MQVFLNRNAFYEENEHAKWMLRTARGTYPEPDQDGGWKHDFWSSWDRLGATDVQSPLFTATPVMGLYLGIGEKRRRKLCVIL